MARLLIKARIYRNLETSKSRFGCNLKIQKTYFQNMHQNVSKRMSFWNYEATPSDLVIWKLFLLIYVQLAIYMILRDLFHFGRVAMEQWSNLPLELVEVIESKLTLYADKVRIRAVCKSWGSRLPILHEHAYLLHRLHGKTEGMHGLFNPIDNKIYEIDVKGVGGKVVKGCSYGWLAIFNDYETPRNNHGREVPLINTFTNAQVDLPPTLSKHHDTKQLMITKIVLSSPFADENCIAVAIYNYSHTISYCKCGEKTWEYFYSDANVQDVIFHEGNLLILNCNGKLSVLEELIPFSKPKFVTRISEPAGWWFPWAYLVKPSTGGIIVVYVNGKIYDHPPTAIVELYKIDLINAEHVRVYDIGDNNIFLDRTSAMMVSSAGYKGNQIYINYGVTGRKFGMESMKKASLSVFDLKKGTLRFLSDPKINFNASDYQNIWVKMN